MAVFLSEAWLAALADAAAAATVPDELELAVQQVVHDESGEVAYAIRLAGGAVHVERGQIEDPDITFTQDRATAAAIAQGTLSAQAAFMAGRMQVSGDLSAVIEAALAVQALDQVFAAARAVTTW